MESLILDPVFRHFYRICQIPHGSGNEQALAQYIVDWARSLGLHASCDAVGNVFIRRTVDAQAPSVLMQAHLDMVCVDTGAARHDFQHDPIPWAISGDTLSTGGKTSLGADDGVGVALAMSMLELERDDFPNLEALFTVREEADMGGGEEEDWQSADFNAQVLEGKDIDMSALKDRDETEQGATPPWKR